MVILRFFFFGKDGRVMQAVHCSNHENLLFPNILVAVAVLVPINNPQSRRKDPLIDKCYVARRTDRFFFVLTLINTCYRRVI